MTARLGAAALVLALAVVAITGWALESGGVAVIETRRPDGGTRATHVWYVEREGALWVEAGAPGNAWFTDVRRDPRVRVVSAGPTGEFVAVPVEEPGRRAWLRAALRERYGWRDRWVGLAVDGSRSVPVRLEPVVENGR